MKKIFRSDSDRKNLLGRFGDLVAETQTDCFTNRSEDVYAPHILSV
ncbi:MAG: hypothetical protein U9N82_06920 [Thermodesulfobacteriota bacterium]|nr:hypothetical protein [Thermodesulfobacteriota bacterium]